MIRSEKPKELPEPSALLEALENLNRLGYLSTHAKTQENRLIAEHYMWEEYRRIVQDMDMLPVLYDKTNMPGVWALML